MHACMAIDTAISTVNNVPAAWGQGIQLQMIYEVPACPLTYGLLMYTYCQPLTSFLSTMQEEVCMHNYQSPCSGSIYAAS